MTPFSGSEKWRRFVRVAVMACEDLVEKEAARDCICLCTQEPHSNNSSVVVKPCTNPSKKPSENHSLKNHL